MKTTRTITLFEQKFVDYQDLGLSPDGEMIENLERINQSCGVELIRLERKGIRTNSYVGVILAGTHIIQILPKIDSDPEGRADDPIGSETQERAAVSAAKNFVHLLAYISDLRLQNQTLAALRTSRGAWLEMLTRLYTVELMTQIQQGFNQDYVRREEMLHYVRGRWNIVRQFIRQPNLPQGLDVSYDDYSPDTLLNRVFRLTTERLKMITQEPSNRQILATLETWLIQAQVTSQSNSEILDTIQFTRLNERFRPAFQLARLFLESQTTQLLVGDKRIYAFVFDMDVLFEQFVFKLLQKKSRRILPQAWEDCRIESQGGKSKKYLILPPNPSEEALFHLKPDILLSFHGAPLLIIDTKNKALPNLRPYRFVDEGDVYQMLTYAQRFKCANVLLLYPRMLGSTQTTPYCLTMDQVSVRLFIATLDLHQPLERVDKLVQDYHQILDYIQSQEEIEAEMIWHE